MTTPEIIDLAATAAELQATIPQTAEAYSSDRAGWLAQRIVGAAALLTDRAAAAGESLNSVPPALPDGFPALGSAWAAPARQWEAIAARLAAHADEDVRATAQQLAAYASTQPSGDPQ